MKQQKLKILVLSDFRGDDANVVRDFLYSFHQHSRHEFFYLHSWKKNNCRRLVELDLNTFDAIVLFWDFFWVGIDDPLSPCFVPPWAVEKIAQSKALKVQFLQDEYRDVRKANGVMARLGVNLMFTCVAEEDHETFYPKNLIPSLQGTYTILTGYVPTYLVNAQSPTFESRPIDIGYRSRTVPPYLGSLGQEKVQIAHNFQNIGQRSGLSTNISVREEDRIYGDRWLQFLRSSRFSLGTESGASVVDFDGEIRRKTSQFLKANASASFEEVKRLFFADVDGKTVIQTISPRIFEAAAFGNTLVLHEGKYAKMIEPDVHYLSIKKDYSNADEVIEKMKDTAYCRRLANRAREDLVQSGKYDYRSFVNRFDSTLENHRPEPSRGGQPSRVVFYANNYLHGDCIVPMGRRHQVLPHPFHLVQRLGRGLPDFFSITLSVRLMFSTLVDNAVLRNRICAWLRNSSEAPVSMAGIARDLRILALLHRARSKVHQYGPPYEVHLDYDEASRKLIFRSMPITENDEPRAASAIESERAILQQRGATPLARPLSWDHSKIGDSFLVSQSRERFFLIFINAQRVYTLEHFHALFHSHPSEELAALDGVLFEPAKVRNVADQVKTFSGLLGAGIRYGLKKSIGKIQTLVRKLPPTAIKPRST